MTVLSEEKRGELEKITPSTDIEKALENWSLAECDALLENVPLMEKLSEKKELPQIECDIEVCNAAYSKEFSSDPDDWSDEEYLEHLKDDNCPINEWGIVRLNREYLHYPEEMRGYAIDSSLLPMNKTEVHKFRVALPIINPDTNELCWLAEETVPVKYLERVEEVTAQVRFDKFKPYIYIQILRQSNLWKKRPIN